MPATLEGLEVPEITEAKLRRLFEKIKPVVTVVSTPKGCWPQDEAHTYFVRDCGDLRSDNIREQPLRMYERNVRLREVGRIRTVHPLRSCEKAFHPTVADVLAQIPECFFSVFPKNEQPIAFEVLPPEEGNEFDESRRFHVATTVLLARQEPANSDELFF